MDSADRERRQESARASLGRGYAIAMQVMAASAMMIVFPLLGRWFDGKCGTAPFLMLGGFVAGGYATFTQLMRIAQAGVNCGENMKESEDEGEIVGKSGPD